MTNYFYSVSGDFSNGVAAGRLHQQIEDDPSITTELIGVSVVDDVCKITFAAALSGAEETALDAVVAAHDGDDPLPTSRPQGFSPAHLDGLDVDRVSNSVCTIEPGTARDADDLGDLVVTETLQADLSVSGAGGLDTGVEQANKWYSLWAIGKNDETVAAMWSLATDKAGLTLPPDYTLARKVAWWRNGSSGNLWAGEMGGKGRLRQQWHDMPDPPIEVLSGGSATSFTPVSLVGQVPPESVVAFIRAQVGGGNYGVIRPNSSFSSLTAVLKIVSGTSQSGLLLAKDREIEYAVNAGTESVAIWCYGWQHTF